jgi:Family of unknown function (DUF6263)
MSRYVKTIKFTMKKIVFTLLIVLLIPLSTYAQKPHKYSLIEGQLFSVTSTVEQTVKQEIPNQGSQVIISNQLLIDDYEVLKKLENGGFLIKSTATKRKVDIDFAGQKVAFDSDDEGPQNLIYQKMTGKTFKFTMSQFGKTSTIEGLDKLREDFTADMKGTPYEATIQQILKIYDEAQIKSNLSSLFDLYPENGPQDEWESEGSMVVNDMLIDLKSENSWDTDATIMKASDLSFEGVIVSNGMEVSMVHAGTMQSIIDVDKSNGLTTLNQSILKTTGTASVNGMNIPQTIEVSSKIEFK